MILFYIFERESFLEKPYIGVFLTILAIPVWVYGLVKYYRSWKKGHVPNDRTEDIADLAMKGILKDKSPKKKFITKLWLYPVIIIFTALIYEITPSNPLKVNLGISLIEWVVALSILVSIMLASAFVKWKWDEKRK